MYTRPSWVPPGAIVHLDFANNRYWPYNVILGNATLGSTRARMQSFMNELNSGAADNTLYAPDSNGILRTFPQYALRITPGRGLWIEGANTNYCQFARNLTGAGWSATNCTVSNTNIPGADGKASGASRVTATSANATIFFPITQASTAFVGSLYSKRNIGSGVINMTIDAGSTYTPVTVGTTGFIQVSVPSQTLANPTIGLQIVNSGDAIDVDMVQCENCLGGITQPTTPMVTAGTTLSRGQEEGFWNEPSVPTGFNNGWPFVNNYSQGGPISGLIIGDGNGVTNCLVTGVDISWQIVGAMSGGALRLTGTGMGSVTTSSNTGNFGLGNTNKCAFSMGGSSVVLYLNGVATVNNSAHFSNSVNSHGGIGNNGSGTIPVNGPTQSCTFWNRELTLGEGLMYTTL